MKEIALPTTDFAENAVLNVSRVFAVLWCIAQNINRKGEQDNDRLYIKQNCIKKWRFIGYC